MTVVSKGLPSSLRQVAREVAFDGTHNGATSIYAYNKINSHVAGRLKQGGTFVGSNKANRSLIKPRKKPSSKEIHRERERQYRVKRVDRELKRMLDRG